MYVAADESGRDRPRRPSQRDHRRGPVAAGLQEAIPALPGDVEGLGPLPLGQEDLGGVEAGGSKTPDHGPTVEPH